MAHDIAAVPWLLNKLQRTTAWTFSADGKGMTIGFVFHSITLVEISENGWMRWLTLETTNSRKRWGKIS